MGRGEEKEDTSRMVSLVTLHQQVEGGEGRPGEGEGRECMGGKTTYKV